MMLFERAQLRARAIVFNNFRCAETALSTRFQRAYNHLKRVVDDEAAAINVGKTKRLFFKINVHWESSSP